MQYHILIPLYIRCIKVCYKPTTHISKCLWCKNHFQLLHSASHTCELANTEKPLLCAPCTADVLSAPFFLSIYDYHCCGHLLLSIKIPMDGIYTIYLARLLPIWRVSSPKRSLHISPAYSYITCIYEAKLLCGILVFIILFSWFGLGIYLNTYCTK